MMCQCAIGDRPLLHILKNVQKGSVPNCTLARSFGVNISKCAKQNRP